MLQWMGGSRRKVTASRKSTQKRQKQYFEQRKRQQHHGEVVLGENHNDGVLTSDRQIGNRSLDVLSLLNVSKVAEDSLTHHEKDNPVTENVSKMANKGTYVKSFEAVDSIKHAYPRSSPSPTIADLEASPNCIERSGTRTPSIHQKSALPSERRNTSRVKNAQSDYLKDASSPNLIGDDGASGSSERQPVHEDHAAFSVEGLGQVGTKTPVQSPQQPERISAGGKSFGKAARKLHFYKNFNMMLNDLEMEEETESLMQDDEKPSFDNYLDSFPISGDSLFPPNGMNNVLSAAKDSTRRDTNQWNIYGDESLVNSWNTNSPSLDDNTFYVKCGTNMRNHNAATDPFFWKNDRPNSMCREKTVNKFDNLDGGGHHFVSSIEPEYSSFMHVHDLQADCSSPPHMTSEDTNNSLNWLRGESCSSSEVRRVDAVNKPSASRRRGYVKSSQRPFMPSVEENDEGVWFNMPSKMRRGEEYDISHKYISSNSAYLSQTTSNNMKMRDEEWLLDEEFPLPNMNSIPDPLFQPSEQSRLYRSDPFHVDPKADLIGNSTNSFGISAKDPRDELKSENAAFCQPFRARKSMNTSFFTTVNCEESWLGLNNDIKAHDQSSNSSPIADIFEEAESATANPDLSAPGVSEEVEDKSKFQPPYPDDNDVTPESTILKDSDGFFGDLKNKSLKETMVFSPDEKATLIAAKIPHGVDAELSNQGSRGNVPASSEQKIKRTSTIANVGGEDLQGRGSETMLFKSSYELMMFQRCVQFLCVLKS